MHNVDRALYDYEGQKEGELSMKVGDLITVSSRDEDGWWEGTLAGRFGQFPASYGRVFRSYHKLTY